MNIFDNHNKIQIILASQSPRRKQLLQQMGLTIQCKPVDIDETPNENEAADDYCQRLAIEKAQVGWQRAKDKEHYIASLGSDTIVVLDEKILGKPQDKKQAYETLMQLSGRTHQVITSVALCHDEKQNHVNSISEVTFRELNKQEVNSYIESNEPMDKAGSYGIQGLAAMWIKHISGSHSGIMGLPIYETAQLIQEFK